MLACGCLGFGLCLLACLLACWCLAVFAFARLVVLACSWFVLACLLLVFCLCLFACVRLCLVVFWLCLLAFLLVFAMHFCLCLLALDCVFWCLLICLRLSCFAYFALFISLVSRLSRCPPSASHLVYLSLRCTIPGDVSQGGGRLGRQR